MRRCAVRISVMTDLISIAEARLRVLGEIQPLPTEAVDITSALGRVLAEDVVAVGDVPPFASSAMDGFAVVAGPAERRLEIIDESRAGSPARRGLDDRQAIRVSTGAVVPQGATAVIRVEDTKEAAGVVTIATASAPGQNIRSAGDDLVAGGQVLDLGLTLGPSALGIAVSAGRTTVTCAQRPRVAVLATGDELMPVGARLAAGQIHNSNAVVLAGLVEQSGAKAITSDPVADDQTATSAAIKAALSAADVVVVTGGVSVGPHDHVKAGFAAAGIQERFWRVALRPGKPVWFGTHGSKLAFGLPGNPVSAVVCFHLFVRPALLALQGASPISPRLSARLASPVKLNPTREQALRVCLRWESDGAVAELTGPQGSHQLSSMLSADALAFIPAGEGKADVGQLVDIELL